MADAPQNWRVANVNGVKCIVPTDDETTAWLQKRKLGSVVSMRVDQVRNAERNALYWCVCTLIAENHPTISDREQASDTLKLLTGLVHVWSVTLPDGEVVYMRRPRSISFAQMPEDEFERFMSAAFACVETSLLPGVDLEELRKEAYLRAGADVSKITARAKQSA
jgi:hypothetical protein